jgi:hypothetical protein
MSWLLWLIGVAIAVIIGLSVFAGYDVPFVVDHIKALTNGPIIALLVAVGLVAVSKVA